MNDISKINNKIWSMGKRRAAIIAPLVKSGLCSREMVLEAANQLNLSTRYIYKLVNNYRRSHGLMTSIIPQKPTGGKGRSRLSAQQEELIKQIIDKFYLTLMIKKHFSLIFYR